jgi:hypothetical protein
MAEKGDRCDCDGETIGEAADTIGDEATVDLQQLEAELKKLPFEIYRGVSSYRRWSYSGTS